MRRFLCAVFVAAMLLCVGCAAVSDVSGRWVSEDNPAYYFELYEDGSVYMFDTADEWVSAGTYTFDRAHIEFTTDTGDFVWVREGDVMVFDNGNTVFVYYRE